MHILGSCSDVASTATFASALKIKVHFTGKMLIQLKEDNTNAIDYQILASMDDTDWFTLKASTTIAKNGSAYETLTDPWTDLDVQIKDTVPAAHGKLDCIIGGN